MAEPKHTPFPETERPRGPSRSPQSLTRLQNWKPLGEVEAERDEMRDRMVRALAEAENSRKRAEKDRRDAQLYGGSKIARDMLPVYDNLARALNAATEETARRCRVGGRGRADPARTDGILQKHGVERICPEVGDRFDPHLHQAMFEAPVPDYTQGQIIQVMAEGFMLHDQLLRPAHVGVSSTPG